MGFSILTYVRTGQEELTQIGEHGNVVIDIIAVKEKVELLRAENLEHEADPDWWKHDVDGMDQGLNGVLDEPEFPGFYDLPIEEIPVNPVFNARRVSILNALGGLVDASQ